MGRRHLLVGVCVFALCLMQSRLIFASSCLMQSRLGSASSPKSVVISCLKEIKRGNYAKSYSFFSSSLKKDVSLEAHVLNLKNIEATYGRLVSFSDRHPLFKNYFWDEEILKDLFKRKKKQRVFRYFLIFEKGTLSLYTEVKKDGNEEKITVFYLH